MSTWQRGSSGALVSLMADIRDARWGWKAGEVEGPCGRMGWTVLEIVDGRGSFVDSGLGISE